MSAQTERNFEELRLELEQYAITAKPIQHIAHDYYVFAFEGLQGAFVCASARSTPAELATLLAIRQVEYEAAMIHQVMKKSHAIPRLQDMPPPTEVLQ